ncbi:MULTISPECIES: LegC family aminotransferase [unclassified Thermosipho (in: thermotogales)]|uniref:LegC family aminotransferase n=1 Tax=unclassified Thermosipho (in: thermotogales) TaxID=2676525 RepID=UPI00098631AE|nr:MULTISPECIES: LegC family aminotransferase [unclassified Thermosipho (in: thermotogales)]MBT1247039.1 aminotransferase DegT [Thermosipho sp. 1244]OOC46898.1 aminotransferase DegT [Thermosipho sp. 1223]
MKYIPLSVPNFIGNEEKYVLDAIKSAWVSTGGSYIAKFEEEIAKYLNIQKAVAVQSGTAGIHLGLKLLGIKPGDEVIVPTLTFIAAVNPVKYLYADPVFMDCDDSLNMDMNKLETFLKKECELTKEGPKNKTTGKIIKAIVIVHVFGNMADMESLMYIAKKYSLKVLEDATEALGTKYVSGKYKEKFAGTIGDVGVYSFNGNKIITTGGGGMLVAKDLESVKNAKYLSTQAKDDALYYIHNKIGYNYRMTNLQAALGVAQLEQLERFIEIKTKNYELYKKLISKIEGLKLLNFGENTRPNYWFYSLFIKSDKISRDSLLKELKKEGIETRPIWYLNHLQKPFKNNYAYKIEKAKYYWERVLNIPCSTNLTEDDVRYVSEKIKEILKRG